MADVPVNAAARSQELQADPGTQSLAQKTQLISELAAAVDNQFNNVMMAVTSYAELELKKAPPAAQRNLEQLLGNVRRAATVIQKLLAVSRSRTSSPQPIALNDEISGLKDLLDQLVGQNVEVVLDLQDGLGKIKVDTVELEELLLTLAIHARNAMSGGGKLLITTKYGDIEDASDSENADHGERVMLSVSNFGTATAKAGPNLDGSTRDLRISSTLAAISRIVKAADGIVRVSREPDDGTTFAINFQALESTAVPAEEDATGKNLPGSRTILVVEDDDAVRVPASEFLKMEGFKVLQAKSGHEAISIAQQMRSPIDLLVTDVVMPAMTGREVAKELAETYPSLKVLFMSGDASAATYGGQRSQEHILQKPFRLDRLNQEIRSLLGE